jgi:hypothetical protein
LLGTDCCNFCWELLNSARAKLLHHPSSSRKKIIHFRVSNFFCKNSDSHSQESKHIRGRVYVPTGLHVLAN